MKRYIYLCAAIVLISCGSSSSSSSITATTTLVSTDLLPSSSQNAIRLKSALSADCSAETLVQCLTPSVVSGKVYYAGIMVGEQGGYSLGPIIGDVVDPSTALTFESDTLLDFDFSDESGLGGGIVCCGGTAYPADADAIVSRIEIYFGWVDATFTLVADDGVETALVGTHTIRTVYATVDGTAYQQGDLLYRGASDSEFLWCTTDEGCIHTSRPESPLQNSDIAGYAGSEDGLGNQSIPTFAASLTSGHAEVQITETQVLNNDFEFTVDFQMTHAIGFTSNISAATRVYDMVSEFSLAAEPGSEDTGFVVEIDMELTERESERVVEDEEPSE
jgi:hypothetical protein